MIRIKELRTEMHKSLRDVANDLNISYSSLSKYERGDQQPSYETLIRIANYFNVSVDYLLGNEKQKNPATDSDEMLMFALYGGDNADITPGMLEDVRNFAQYIREKNKGKNN